MKPLGTPGSPGPDLSIAALVPAPDYRLSHLYFHFCTVHLKQNEMSLLLVFPLTGGNFFLSACFKIIKEIISLYTGINDLNFIK
jgi:hypothetical protein